MQCLEGVYFLHQLGTWLLRGSDEGRSGMRHSLATGTSVINVAYQQTTGTKIKNGLVSA